MVKILFSLLLAMAFFTTNAPLSYAQSDEEPVVEYDEKNAIYYMKDGSEFTEEEMDEEAQFIYNRCSTNVIHSRLFDCGCIAGAFRQVREKVNYGMQQAMIYNSLLTDRRSGCANTPAIAGESFNRCMEFSKYYRERKANNKQFCECVARKVALDFSKKPTMDLDYVNDLRTEAMSSCDGPVASN